MEVRMVNLHHNFEVNSRGSKIIKKYDEGIWFPLYLIEGIK